MYSKNIDFTRQTFVVVKFANGHINIYEKSLTRLDCMTKDFVAALTTEIEELQNAKFNKIFCSKAILMEEK